MTYGIVTAILLLALISVVLAVVFATDEDANPEGIKSALSPNGGVDVDPAPQPAAPDVLENQEEHQASDIRIMDVSAEADRDSRTVGI